MKKGLLFLSFLALSLSSCQAVGGWHSSEAAFISSLAGGDYIPYFPFEGMDYHLETFVSASGKDVISVRVDEADYGLVGDYCRIFEGTDYLEVTDVLEASEQGLRVYRAYFDRETEGTRIQCQVGLLREGAYVEDGEGTFSANYFLSLYYL